MMPNISLRLGLIRFSISHLKAGLESIDLDELSKEFQRSVVDGKKENLNLSVLGVKDLREFVPLSLGLGLWSLIILKRYFGFS